MKNNIKVVVLLQVLVIAVMSAIGYFGYNQLQQTKKTQTQMQTELSFIHTQFKKAFDAQRGTEPLDAGTIAPDFMLKDTNDKDVSLATLNPNKQRILIFSSSDCSYCTEYYPELDEFARANRDIEVVIIQSGSTPESNKQFITDNNYGFKVLAGDEHVTSSYKVEGTPTTIILDNDNTILATGYPLKSKELEYMMKNLNG